MQFEKNISTTYDAGNQILATHLNGDVNENDVQQWIDGFTETINNIPDNTRFKVLVDLYGFKADSLDTHKLMRTVVPSTLSRFGHMVGYVKLFDPNGIETTVSAGRYCVAAAHVHHDETKIALYQNSYAAQNELFTTDQTKAHEWIRNYSI